MTEQLLLLQPAKRAQDGDRFRSIHYLGSKLRLVDAINDALASLDPAKGPVCDLFAGSGVVSRHQAAHRDVVAVDIQEYSRVLAAALLRSTALDQDLSDWIVAASTGTALRGTLLEAFGPLLAFEEEALRAARAGDGALLATLTEGGSVRGAARTDGGAAHRSIDKTRKALKKVGLLDDPATAISATYGGVYFSYRQAIDLDCLLEAGHQQVGVARDVVLAGIMSAASELVASVGNHFAQPLNLRNRQGEVKPSAIRHLAKLRAIDGLSTAGTSIGRYVRLDPIKTQTSSIRADYRTFLSQYSGDLGVIYADPPYTRDHYSRFYHVLETMALRDTPQLEKRIRHGVAISRGLYRHARHQSPFCIKTQAPQAFVDLFTGSRRFGVPLCVSYSPFDASSRARPRMMSIGDIVDIARRSFRHVSVLPVAGVSHSKLNHAMVNVPTVSHAEALIVCSV